ncbi:hypothetical protein CMV_021975 [Castanea mollissima]|uniref:Cation efflux protein transmembrane domain-containing protein n=1 Tax=Castanea mollissima TaxID=60419 RepID=A0A8J4QV15_9ROSI|nr:hypothetical protein CMV_021975 [Castanea mollissima]
MEMAASAIGKMVLDVSGNSFRNLPNSISKLKNLKNVRLLELGNLGLKHLRDLEPLLPPEVEKDDIPSKCYSKSEPLFPPEVEKNDMPSKSCSKSGPLLSPEVEKNDMPSKSCCELEALLPPEVEKNDMPSDQSWKINLGKFPPLPERRDAEHGSFTLKRLLRTPIRKRHEVDDYYMKQMRQLEGYTEIETMIETGCAPGNPAEDEMKPKRERMAILVTNIASIVLFALMVFASIESKSLSIIASILDPFFDLLWGFILWLTSHAMQNPNQHRYPIGMKRLQPVQSSGSVRLR